METEYAEQLLNEAITLFDNGDLEGALVILTTIVESPITFDLLRRTIEETPLALDVLRLMGKIKWKLGCLPEAILCFRKASRHYPKDEAVSLGLFHTLCSNGQDDEAQYEMERFLSLAPSPKYESFRGRFYYHQGLRCEHDSQRVLLFKYATEADPEFSEAFTELGQSYLKLGKIEEAELAYRRSITLNDGWGHLYLGNLFFGMENWDAAEKEFIEGQQRLPELAVPVKCQADVYRKRGDLKRSEQLYREAVKLEPNDSSMLAYLGRFLLENNQRAEGAEYIKRALEKDASCEVALKWKQQFNVCTEAEEA